ncbi:sodium-dependent glucose transporter 1-like isoform X1 [Styela clava]
MHFVPHLIIVVLRVCYNRIGYRRNEALNLTIKSMATLNIWTISLIIAISLARIGLAAIGSLFGPTLLYVADQVNVSVTTISTLSTGKAVGGIFGAVLGGIIKNLVGPNFRHLVLFGISCFIFGILQAVIPWTTNFWILMGNYILNGVLYGYLESAMQAFILQTWESKSSAPFIHLFHMMHSFGSFATPLIAGYFLALSDADAENNYCPGKILNAINSTLQLEDVGVNKSAIDTIEINQAGWAFIVTACFIVLVSIVFFVLALADVEGRISEFSPYDDYFPVETEEKPSLTLVSFFVIVVGYFLCVVSASGLFSTYIYAVTLCSNLEFSITSASQINSLFWFCHGCGRLSGVIASNYISTKTIIKFGIAGSIFSMTILSVFGERVPWIPWVISALHGYTVSILYPAGVSWVSEITNISGTYMFVPSVGSLLEKMIMVPLGGFILDLNAFSVIYLIFGFSLGTAITFGMMIIMANYKSLLNDQTKKITAKR